MFIRPLRYIFGQLQEDKRLIPYARLRDTGQVVRLPEDPFEEGQVHYDEALHKGNLICPCCDAAIHYERAKTVSGGGNRTPGEERFVTNPGQTHDPDCEVENSRKRKNYIDPKAGYKIFLNMLTRRPPRSAKYDFSRANHYRKNKDRAAETRVAPESLRQMESVQISNIDDAIDMLRTKDPDRLWNGVVIHLNNQFQARHFMLLYGKKGERFKVFVGGLLDNAGRRRQQPVLIEIRALKGPQEKTRRMVSEIIEENDPETGRKRTIVPAIYIDGKQQELIDMTAHGGHFLVLGFARVHAERNDSKDEDIFYLNVSVRDPNQIKPANPRKLRRENDRRRAEKDAAAEPAPD